MNNRIAYLLLFLFSIGFSTSSFSQKINYQTPIGKKPRTEKVKKQKTVNNSFFGYQANIEGGVTSKYFTGDSLYFSGLVSNGVHYKNSYIGLGIGFESHEKNYIVPIFADLRFTLTGNRYKVTNGGSEEKRNALNLFIYFKGGGAIFDTSLNHIKKNLFLGGGLGFLFGTQDDLRMTLKFGYQYNNLNRVLEFQNSVFEFFTIKLGVEIIP